MKVRQGFVSNSSTSSYMIIIPTENFEEVVSKMGNLSAKIIRDLVQDEKVIGIDAKLLSYCSGNDDTFEPHDLDYDLQVELEKEVGVTIEEDMYPFYEMLREAMNKYGDLVKKHDKGFYYSEYH